MKKYAVPYTKKSIKIVFKETQENIDMVKCFPGVRMQMLKGKKTWLIANSRGNIETLIEFGYSVSPNLIKCLNSEKEKLRAIRKEIKQHQTTYKLRAYQILAVASGIEFFRSQSLVPAIMVLPTGAGKSIVISEIAKVLDAPVLILQPNKELLEQNYSKYVGYGLQAGIYSASKGRKEIEKVTFATIGSIYRKPKLFTQYPYCIIDECHLVPPDKNSMYSKFYAEVKMKTIGLTATPVRLKAYNEPYPHSRLIMLDQMKPKFFKQFLHVTQIENMVRRGYFVPMQYHEKPYDSRLLKINTMGSDYTQESMRACFKENKQSLVIKKITEYTNINHILIFVPSIENAYELRSEIPFSEVLESGMEKQDRESVLERFKAGEIKTIINVNILTLGFDFPALDCIIMARPTQSFALYYQMIGRAVRPSPGKQTAHVFDLVKNVEKFGRVERIKIQPVKGKMQILSGLRVLTNEDIMQNEKNYKYKPYLNR